MKSKERASIMFVVIFYPNDNSTRKKLWLYSHKQFPENFQKKSLHSRTVGVITYRRQAKPTKGNQE